MQGNYKNLLALMICNAETTQQLTNVAIALANINNIKYRHALITVHAIEI